MAKPITKIQNKRKTRDKRTIALGILPEKKLIGGNGVMEVTVISPMSREYKDKLHTKGGKIIKSKKYITLAESKRLDSEILQARFDWYEKISGPNWYKN